ncbi:unnamed protein product [Gadus morhua 'NCC']
MRFKMIFLNPDVPSAVIFGVSRVLKRVLTSGGGRLCVTWSHRHHEPQLAPVHQEVVWEEEEQHEEAPPIHLPRSGRLFTDSMFV